MEYKIVFDTSSDHYSSDRRSVKASAEQLAAKITALQAAGRIIYSVSVA